MPASSASSLCSIKLSFLSVSLQSGTAFGPSKTSAISSKEYPRVSGKKNHVTARKTAKKQQTNSPSQHNDSSQSHIPWIRTHDVISPSNVLQTDRIDKGSDGQGAVN